MHVQPVYQILGDSVVSKANVLKFPHLIIDYCEASTTE